MEDPSMQRRVLAKTISPVMNLTRSPCAFTARAQVPTNLEKPGTIFVHVLIFPALSVRQPADAMHIKCVHELYSMVPQHQFVRKMHHLSRDGGQAVRVRDLHRAGAHDQQHRYVRADERDLQLLHGRLHHRHGSCAVFCEDLTAEERMLYLL